MSFPRRQPAPNPDDFKNYSGNYISTCQQGKQLLVKLMPLDYQFKTHHSQMLQCNIDSWKQSVHGKIHFFSSYSANHS